MITPNFKVKFIKMPCSVYAWPDKLTIHKTGFGLCCLLDNINNEANGDLMDIQDELRKKYPGLERIALRKVNEAWEISYIGDGVYNFKPCQGKKIAIVGDVQDQDNFLIDLANLAVKWYQPEIVEE